MPSLVSSTSRRSRFHAAFGRDTDTPPLRSQGAHLTQNQFNWLGTIFYLSFLVFQYPQNLALQYLPVGKWMRCARLASRVSFAGRGRQL